MGTLLMSFLKVLFGRCLTGTRLTDFKKNAEKLICLKTPSKFIGLALRITNSQNQKNKFHACPETFVEFFFTTKKKIKREKIFQTCSMNIRGIFFSRLFFLSEKNPRNCTPHWLLKQKYFCFQPQSQAIPRGIETVAFTKISVPVIL